jgi:hypothetical protein
MVSIKNVKLKVANIVLPFFLKSSHNPDDGSLLVISFKFLAMLSFEASLVAIRLHQTWNQSSTILLCNRCAQVVYRPSFPLLHPTCLRSKFWQTKEMNHYQRNLRKTMMSLANVETSRLYIFHE